MSLAAAVIDCLVENGVHAIFGVPGNQTLPLNREVDDRDDIEYVMARTEVAVTHAAWGYVESSGAPAATLVVPGPGDMHAMNGLKNAANDDTPIVHITAETDPEDVGAGALHEADASAYDTVVKENIAVARRGATVPELRRAISVALTPPGGPVRVGIPRSFLVADAPPVHASFTPGPAPTASPAAIESAAAILAEAERPVVLAGGGIRARSAADELRSLAEALDAPVVTTRKGKGVFPEDHPLSLGTATYASKEGINGCLAEADVALAVGTTLDKSQTLGWTLALPDQLVTVSLHGEHVGRGYPVAVGLVADPPATLRDLEARLAGGDVGGANGAARAAAAREATRRRLEGVTVNTPLSTPEVFDVLRDAIPRDAVVSIPDAGGFRMWADAGFDAYGPRRFIAAGHWTTMGTGLPAAIGAKVANPDRPVVAVTGDGALLMCSQELHTAVREGIPVVTIVLNNDDYAIISDVAERTQAYEPGAYGWHDRPVDFVELARSVGMPGERAATADELRRAVTDAVDTAEPALIEVPTDPDEPIPIQWK